MQPVIPATSGEPAAWSDPARTRSGFVAANGIRLHYLDWEARILL